jgi:hypothetical protein
LVVENGLVGFSESFISFKVIPISPMSQFEINLNIKKKKEEGLLGISEIAIILKGLQDAIYDIAESALSQKKGFRIAGKRDALIEKRTKLTFKSVSTGSFHSTVVGEPIEAIHGKTMVDEAIDIFGTISYSLNESEKAEIEIKNLIPDPLYRARIVSDIDSFWPGFENRYDIDLDTQNFKHKSLKPERRSLIRSLAVLEKKQIKQTTIGVISGGHFIKKRMFEIEGPDGKIKCEYKKDLDNQVINFLRHPVMVEGLLTTTAGKPRVFPEVFSIKPLKKITLSRIITEKEELKLKESINVDISFKDDMWFFEYPKLNIIAYGDTYNETIKMFQEDFIELYEHYALGDSSKMKGKAIEIRKFLLNNIEN